MKQFVVAVRDRAACAYGKPGFVSSLGVAIRSFSDEVNRESKDNSLYMHPDDYDLYELGTYDDTTGKMVSFDDPKLLSLGKQVKIVSL